jgi:hypothetical protein
VHLVGDSGEIYRYGMENSETDFDEWVTYELADNEFIVGLNSYDNQLELKYSDASLGQIKAYTIDIIGYLGLIIATNNCYPARETACVAIGEEKCSRWYCLWWVWLLILIGIILLALCFY